MTESSADTGRHRAAPAPRHRVLHGFGYVVLAAVLTIGLFGVFTYRHLNENLTILDLDDQLGNRPEAVKVEGPKQPINVLVMGSDSRDGAGNNIDGLSGGGQRSDTTILFHLSADRQHAYGVSLPRDAMVQRPDCGKNNQIPGGFAMFNTAFALGGPACTIKQVESLTGIHIDHFVVVKFQGFKDMVNAIDGVEVCIPEDVDDSTGNIHLKAGTREVKGKEALDYVRVRHNISNNGDIGRMKRQQVFIAAMANKVMSSDVMTRPDRIFSFLSAATQSLTLDSGLDSVKRIADLAGEFRNIGLDNIKFITVPWDFYAPDPNRLVWAEDADLVWKKIRFDQPLSRELSSEVITAAQRPGSTNSPNPSDSTSPDAEPSPGATGIPSDQASEDAEQLARANGLCA